MNSLMNPIRRPVSRPALRRVLAAGGLSVLCASIVLLMAPSAWGAPNVDFEASIGGQDVLGGEEIRLDPDAEPTLKLSVTNNTNREIGVRAVRLLGDVLGATFYSYDTAIGMQLDPGETEDREFSLDLFALRGQAVGLIPSHIELIDLERETLVSRDFVGDVQGSLRSTYGYFGLGIAVLTIAGLFNAIKNFVQDELSDSRWARGGTFALPGTGLGLTIVFTLSALRLFVPTNESAGLVTAALAAVFLVFGYLTPNPKEEEEEQPSIRLEAKSPAPPPPRQPEGVGGGRS